MNPEADQLWRAPRWALAVLLADTKQACTIMTNSLRRAADLITSFKQVAVDQTSDKRRRFDFAEVLHDTLATFAAQLRRMNCDVDVDCPKALILDSYPGSVGQVLSNLINNVLLHAFEGRTMGKLAITVRETDDDQVLLVFSDDGVGMSPKVLHQVFDPFFTTKMGQGGSGLGMNIVYNIVTGMLGGSIDIESSTDHGTSVTIKIPPDWSVVLQGTPILGGFEEKTIVPPNQNKRLYVTGYAIMGGLEIRN